MKKFALLSTIILLHCNSFLYGQFYSNNRDNIVLESKRDIDNTIRLNNSNTSIDLKDVKGSPYAKESFNQGRIFNKKLGTKYSYFLRYNVYNDIIEIKNGNQAVELLKTSNLYALFNGSEYHFEKYVDDAEDGIRKGYFELLQSGKKYKLYSKNFKKYNPPVKAETPYNKNHPATFTDSKKFYVQENDLNIVPLNKRKKHFLRQFPNMSKEIGEYINSQNTDLSSEEDLIQLFTYMDGLLK